MLTFKTPDVLESIEIGEYRIWNMGTYAKFHFSVYEKNTGYPIHFANTFSEILEKLGIKKVIENEKIS